MSTEVVLLLLFLGAGIVMSLLVLFMVFTELRKNKKEKEKLSAGETNHFSI